MERDSGAATIRERLALATILVGISFVGLVFVAVPLKRLMDVPMAMRIAGPIHGVLFAWFAFELWRFARAQKLTASKVGWAVLLASIPFGAFVYLRELRRLDVARGA
jgi:integral membrane protein